MSRGILVLGASGILGRAWCEFLTRKGIPFRTAGRPGFDLGDAASIGRVVTGDVDLVVNCAGWTDVDGAERNEGEAFRLNATGVAHLADRCADRGATLVHYSTDYVFSGEPRPNPWPTDAPRAPVNAYGRSKAAGEEALEDSIADYLMVRTSWLYAPWGRNFVTTIASLVQSRDELKVVDDQRGRPSSAVHVAANTWRLLEERCRGTYHLCDGGECTWFEFAYEINSLVGGECRITPCKTQAVGRAAARPRFSVLDLADTERKLGAAEPWRDSLSTVARELVRSPTP